MKRQIKTKYFSVNVSESERLLSWLFIVGLCRHPSVLTLRLIVFLLDLHWTCQRLHFCFRPLMNVDGHIKVSANKHRLGHRLCVKPRNKGLDEYPKPNHLWFIYGLEIVLGKWGDYFKVINLRQKSKMSRKRINHFHIFRVIAAFNREE